MSADNQCIQWWCGNWSYTICAAGVNASFVSYSGGSILGFPPVTSPPSAAADNSRNIVTTTFSAKASSEVTTDTASPPAKTSTDNPISAQTTAQSSRQPTAPPTPDQTQEHAASLPTAIGVGIGVPLGIATVGFLGFLFWKEAARQRRKKPRILSQESVFNNWDQSAVAATDGPRSEMPDDQRPGELGGNARVELSSS